MDATRLDGGRVGVRPGVGGSILAVAGRTPRNPVCMRANSGRCSGCMASRQRAVGKPMPFPERASRVTSATSTGSRQPTFRRTGARRRFASPGPRAPGRDRPAGGTQHAIVGRIERGRGRCRQLSGSGGSRIGDGSIVGAGSCRGTPRRRPCRLTAVSPTATRSSPSRPTTRRSRPQRCSRPVRDGPMPSWPTRTMSRVGFAKGPARSTRAPRSVTVCSATTWSGRRPAARLRGIWLASRSGRGGGPAADGRVPPRAAPPDDLRTPRFRECGTAALGGRGDAISRPTRRVPGCGRSGTRRGGRGSEGRQTGERLVLQFVDRALIGIEDRSSFSVTWIRGPWQRTSSVFHSPAGLTGLVLGAT